MKWKYVKRVGHLTVYSNSLVGLSLTFIVAWLKPHKVTHGPYCRHDA